MKVILHALDWDLLAGSTLKMLPYFNFHLARAKISPFFSISSRFPKIGQGNGPEQPHHVPMLSSITSFPSTVLHMVQQIYVSMQLIGLTGDIPQAKPCYRVQQCNQHLQRLTMWGAYRLLTALQSTQLLARRRTTRVKAKKSQDTIFGPKKVMTGQDLVLYCCC